MAMKISELVNIEFKLLVWLDEYAENEGMSRNEAIEKAIGLLKELSGVKKEG